MKKQTLLAVIACVAVVVLAYGCGPAPTPTLTPTETLLPLPSLTPTPAGPALGDTRIRPADGMVMVYVPAGEFTMGSTDQEVDAAVELCNEYQACKLCEQCAGDCERARFEDERPAHEVALGGFWIDRTEVTNAQYAQCAADGVCEPPEYTWSSSRDSYYGDSAYEDYPVLYVDLYQAESYCAWAGGRLPTEAEWEYAARGPQGYTYPWGNEFDGTRLNYCDVRCYLDWADESVDDGYADTAPVGSYPTGASWVGALDMAGNVGEWVADWWGEYPSERQVNPTGPSSGDTGVTRGGSLSTKVDSLRSAYRGWDSPNGQNLSLGFRCAGGFGEGSAPAPTEGPTSAPTERPTPTPTPTPASPTPIDTRTRPADGMVMVYVPAGEFLMGSTDEEVDAAKACAEQVGYMVVFTWEQPAHPVALDGFWIDQTEVTNAQYAGCVAAGVCQPPTDSRSYTRDSYYGNSAHEDYPVIWVDWYRAEAYCEWAGVRLPTEAEWEYAARGPEGVIFPWGDKFDGLRLNGCGTHCIWDWATWAFDDGYDDTAPVGSYPTGASWVGALDMAGNVLEWVADWYGEYTSGRQVNPTGPAVGDERVVRGGDGWRGWLDARTASRSYYSPDYLNSFVGFRCAATPGE